MRDGDGCGSILLAIAIGLAAWWWIHNHSGKWTGWIYPDANDLTVSIKLGEFRDFEACQAAAINNLRSMRAADGGDYECGRSCKFRPELGLDVCKETRK